MAKRRSDEKRLREKERERDNGESRRERERRNNEGGPGMAGRTQWRGCTESYGYR